MAPMRHSPTREAGSMISFILPCPVSFILPWPVSTNRYWRHYRNRTCLSPEAIRFRDSVASVIRMLHEDRHITSPVAVSVILYPPDRKRRDLDNWGGKALLDALTYAGVWQDDSQVKELLIRWGEVIERGKTVVSIYPYEDGIVFGAKRVIRDTKEEKTILDKGDDENWPQRRFYLPLNMKRITNIRRAMHD